MGQNFDRNFQSGVRLESEKLFREHSCPNNSEEDPPPPPPNLGLVRGMYSFQRGKEIQTQLLLVSSIAGTQWS